MQAELPVLASLNQMHEPPIPGHLRLPSYGVGLATMPPVPEPVAPDRSPAPPLTGTHPQLPTGNLLAPFQESVGMQDDDDMSVDDSFFDMNTGVTKTCFDVTPIVCKERKTGRFATCYVVIAVVCHTVLWSVVISSKTTAWSPSMVTLFCSAGGRLISTCPSPRHPKTQEGGVIFTSKRLTRLRRLLKRANVQSRV